ncbi:GNAT family N-acetyltransferase [Ruminococcaceae bacterium OttesenSCG-928-D13]|nr:GNAT family N-acetyltransferase [Ruminococcaceae bacterium OttesenSCG-928-D13]
MKTMVEIREISSRDDAILKRIQAVWESSVRATHTFLTEADIVALRPEVWQGAEHIDQLYGFFDDDNALQGFIGVQGKKIEMLFVDAAARGQGIGGKLLRFATGTLGANAVDVNEQNGQGAAFYAHMGFEMAGRSALDEQGRPFPILHLEMR